MARRQRLETSASGLSSRWPTARHSKGRAHELDGFPGIVVRRECGSSGDASATIAVGQRRSLPIFSSISWKVRREFGPTSVRFGRSEGKNVVEQWGEAKAWGGAMVI